MGTFAARLEKENAAATFGQCWAFSIKKLEANS